MPKASVGRKSEIINGNDRGGRSNPPFHRFLGFHYNANALGIAYIASYLDTNRHDACCITITSWAKTPMQIFEKYYSCFLTIPNILKKEDADILKEVVEKIIKFQPWLGGTYLLHRCRKYEFQ